MKPNSIQIKFLLTIISAIIAITLFVGGLSIYEVDDFAQTQTENFINATCEKEAAQINDIFGDMEKSVHIMESYVYGLINDESDIKDSQKQEKILEQSNEMFIDVAKHTDSAVAYYLRFDPDISHGTCGFFYSKEQGKGSFVRYETTDILRYDRNDTAHVGWYWQAYDAGEPVWLLPYYNKNNGILMISYVVPMFYNNEFFGIVGMDFDYTVLIERVHDIKIYENGFAILEFYGSDIANSDHMEDIKIHENPEKYLSVSYDLKNGMKLVISSNRDDIRSVRHAIALKIIIVAILLAVTFSLIVIYIVKKIVRPLKMLTDASVKLSNEDYDFEIIHDNTYEIELLSTAFENMARSLKEHEKLQHLLAYRDSLTGLRNTNSYKVWINNFDKEIENQSQPFGLVIFDINFLKETNDKYGHDAGNQLIVEAASIISSTFKRSPVFRIGGDEFLAILQNRDFEDADELLEKFDADCVNKAVVIDEEIIPVSIAKGFAIYDPLKDTKFIEVFNRADDAMYENKRIMKGVK